MLSGVGMRLPKKITPCPITEVVVEVRFDSELPEDAIFGVIYNQFRSRYRTAEKLPILQIPEAIRSQDPNLKFSPHYRIQDENFLIQIGPKAFSLVNVKEYCGWECFSQRIYETFATLADLNIMNNILRFGLRYINMFDNLNIYDKSNLKVFLNKQSFGETTVNLTMEIPAGEYVNQLKVINHAQVMVAKSVRKGSLIDIDTALSRFSGNFFEGIHTIVEDAHTHEKQLFFSLLQDDFIASLHPVY
jgi:uncharacterized protein (TIGR04255 family)